MSKNVQAAGVVIVVALVGFAVSFTPDLSSVVDFIGRALTFIVNHG